MTGGDFVPCLGETLEYTVDFSGVFKELLDANGGYHINMNGRLSGEFESLDSDATWTARGRRHWILNSNMDWDPVENNGNNREQFRRTYREKQVLYANGDDPDLLWSLEFTIVVNANFEFGKEYFDGGTYTCMYE